MEMWVVVPCPVSRKRNIMFYYVELRFHAAIVGFRVRAVK